MSLNLKFLLEYQFNLYWTELSGFSSARVFSDAAHQFNP